MLIWVGEADQPPQRLLVSRRSSLSAIQVLNVVSGELLHICTSRSMRHRSQTSMQNAAAATCWLFSSAYLLTLAT